MTFQLTQIATVATVLNSTASVRGLVISSLHDSTWSQRALKYLWWAVGGGTLQTGRDRLQRALSRPSPRFPRNAHENVSSSEGGLSSPCYSEPLKYLLIYPRQDTPHSDGRQPQIILYSGTGRREAHVSLYGAKGTEFCGRASGYPSQFCKVLRKPRGLSEPPLYNS